MSKHLKGLKLNAHWSRKKEQDKKLMDFKNIYYKICKINWLLKLDSNEIASRLKVKCYIYCYAYIYVNVF